MSEVIGTRHDHFIHHVRSLHRPRRGCHGHGIHHVMALHYHYRHHTIVLVPILVLLACRRHHINMLWLIWRNGWYNGVRLNSRKSNLPEKNNTINGLSRVLWVQRSRHLVPTPTIPHSTNFSTSSQKHKHTISHQSALISPKTTHQSTQNFNYHLLFFFHNHSTPV